jgi:hypothetical protein
MRKLLLLTAFVLMTCMVGWAQGITTSSLTGQVTDAQGGSIPGANVVATHVPTGTEYGTATNENGRFNIPNMRVGGPYTVNVSFVGNKPQTFNDVYIKLGEPFKLDVKLAEESTELSEVVVLGAQDRLMSSERHGTITSVSTREIMTMPTISRSINDMTRFTPQATSTSNGAIGGGNYRQNYITVDGSEFNNTFGIGTNLPAGGSPISLDALEEISVNVTPYDVRQSAFIGSSINAITRSGTNDFSGSAYWFFRSDKQQGDQVRSNALIARQKLDEDTYGFRLGGPIMKNKLFFFINAERTKTIRPGQTNKAATADAPFGSDPSISRPTVDFLNEVSGYLRNNYQYETGSFQGYDFESENTKLTARLDWNINKNHRVSLRYSQVESQSPSFLSTSLTSSNIANFSTTRTSNNSMWFENTNYFQDQNLYSIALEANSLFGNLANTFRASFTHQNDPRSSNSSEFPFVDILDGSGATATPITSFGYEPFSYGNLRDVKSYSFVDFVTMNTGIHNLMAGVQIDFQQTRNGFQPFGTGYYVYNSWNDFTGGANPRDYVVTYSLLPGFAQAYPKIGFAQYSAYAQDEMNLTDRLRVSLGLRLDLPTFPGVPEIKTNPLVAGLAFENGETMDTGKLPDTRVMFSPRVGFNWDVKGDRTIQVRGGTGVFTGRVPTVWIVAQSGNSGMIQITQTVNGVPNTSAAGITFRKEPWRPDSPPAAGTVVNGATAAIAPDFKFPQTWKSNLAIDAQLPGGIVGTLEGIYNKDLNIAMGRNINLVAPQALNVVDADGASAYPDSRPIYPSTVPTRFINPLTSLAPGPTNPNPSTPVANGDARGTQALNAIVLDNGSEGYYWSLTAKLEKQFDNGLSAFMAYTRSKSNVLYDGVGDQILNVWSITPITNTANDPGTGPAGYVVPDRLIAGLSYRKEYLKHFATTVSLFMEGSSQGRFSYIYGGDFNRDGQTNDLIYVPNDPSEITFVDFDYDPGAGVKTYTAAQQSEIFFRYIEQDQYLSSRKGKYAERNGALMPWRNQFDLKIIQDIFTNVGGKKNTIQLSLDIFNFGNWLNKDWGTFDLVNANNILVPINAGSLVAGGTVKPTFRLQSDRGQPVATTYRDNNTITSTYYMQFGIRYIFN